MVDTIELWLFTVRLQYYNYSPLANSIVDPVDPHLSLYDEDNANTVITLADWYHLVRRHCSQLRLRS